MSEATKSEESADIVAAIEALDPNDPALWTQNGQPDSRALGERVGRRVSAAERDAAWDACQERGIGFSRTHYKTNVEAVREWKLTFYRRRRH